MGIHLLYSTTFHPQVDGQSEKTIHMLKDRLRVTVMQFDESWDVICL